VDAGQKVLSLDGVSVERDIGDDLPPVQVDADYASRILTDLIVGAGACSGVGAKVNVSTELRVEGGQPGHLVLLIQGARTEGPDVPPLEEDENIRTAVSLAEDVGGRIWMERQDDGSSLICLLLPLAEQIAL
jgi:hypothetical protein